MLDTPPGPGTPQQADPHPLESRPPGTRHPPSKADPPRTVHAGRYGQQAGGMHPYWNAIFVTLNNFKLTANKDDETHDKPH